MISGERIRQIRDEDGLCEFLSEELGWPTTGVLDTHPFYPDELGLTEDEAREIKAVSQVASFEKNQPWGIFLVEFAGERVYRRALRRVLRGLSESRRDRDASLPAWKASNLLFICTPNYRDFTFARFDGDTHTRGTLSLFGWEQADTGGLRTLCEHNLPALRYPDSTTDSDGWLRQWASAWDVERVTKKFYDEYEAVFTQVEGMVQGVQGDKRLFTQRLFNRLMFIHFLSKKGWLRFGGRTDYLRALFAKAQADGENFYHDRLYWAFFHGLGTLRDSREAHGLEALHALRGDVPYLNGGLFEMADADDARGAVTIPNGAFGLILDRLFDRFNFTVQESTPLDIEVAVDPEMLGSVFEKLVTGRHETGSYYTPRPVVAFMCREAIKGYLGGYDALVDQRDASGVNVPTARALLGKLAEIKVVDPACGSGAYLLGMLQELHELTRLLDTRAEQASARDDYQRKLGIIRNSLYGVDRDEFAVNIARLRLWLSLAVEFEGDVPEPLPNLDFKIEVGDSLSAPAPQGGPTADIFRQRDIEDFERAKAEFADPYYQGDKVALKGKIETLRRDIAAWMHPSEIVQGFDWRVEYAEVFEPKEPTATIGGAMNFGQELAEQPRPGGFDVVLANPPYVRQELIRDQKPMLAKVYPEVFAGTADLYCYFYARALHLLRPGGMLVFISPNKWFRAGYGAKLRGHVGGTCAVRAIVDFGDLPVFQEATAYPSIIVAQKGGTQGNAVFTAVQALVPPYPDVLALVARDGQKLPCEAVRGSDWAVTNNASADRLRKMGRAGVPLRDYINGKAYRGVLTGFNRAFVIDGAKRAELIAADKHSAEIIKPLAAGRDVKKWAVEFRDAWLVFTRRGININDYPAIKDYLQQWRHNLEPRPRDWDEPTNGRWAGRKPGSYKWYEIQDEIAYFKEFGKPKILYQEIATFQSFAYDTTGAFANNKVFLIPTDDLYLLGVLNSTPAWDYLQSVCSKLVGGALAMQTPYVLSLPVPNASTKDRAAITALVQKCLDARGIGCEAWEQEINDRVAALYGL